MRGSYAGLLCGAPMRGGFCRVGFVSRGLREQFRGAVFVGAFVGCLLRGGALTARLAGVFCRAAFNCAFCGGGASQSRFSWASLGLADVSEPSGRGGTTMRLFVRRGFGPGRLLTGGGFGSGRLLTGWFLSGVALVRGGVEPTWLRAGRLRIPRRSYGDATGSPPTRSGRGRRSRWP